MEDFAKYGLDQHCIMILEEYVEARPAFEQMQKVMKQFGNFGNEGVDGVGVVGFADSVFIFRLTELAVFIVEFVLELHALHVAFGVFETFGSFLGSGIEYGADIFERIIKHSHSKNLLYK